MKIIVAGYPKTGTKTMTEALEKLGYVVYDHYDHFYYHGKEWNKLLTTGGTTEDFKRMYKDVDVVVDSPCYYFWQEIHQAFPDAKIILGFRDEKSWYASLRNQIGVLQRNITYSLMQTLTLTGRKLFEFRKNYITVLYGYRPQTPWGLSKSNLMIERQNYRKHNAHVIMNAPQDKLLVYDVKDGWDPLCKFLNKEIPKEPFPHKNVGGEVVAEMMKTHPLFKQMKTELYISFALLVAFGAATSYFAFTKVNFSKITLRILSC